MHLIITGGTIDMVCDTKQQMRAPARHSQVMRYVQSLQLPYDITYTVLCLKDARDLDQNDLDRLTQEVLASSAQDILITHGFQTMRDSMRYLHQQAGEGIAKQGKTVMFLDNTIPLSQPGTNAPQQLTKALDILQSQPAGVWAIVDGICGDEQWLQQQWLTGTMTNDYAV